MVLLIREGLFPIEIKRILKWALQKNEGLERSFLMGANIAF